MIDSTLEPKRRQRLAAVNRAARDLDLALADLDDVERRALQACSIDSGGLPGDTLRSLASLARALDGFDGGCTVNGRPAPRLADRADRHSRT